MNRVWKPRIKEKRLVSETLKATYEHLRANGMFACDENEDSPFFFVEKKLRKLIERVDDPEYMESTR